MHQIEQDKTDNGRPARVASEARVAEMKPLLISVRDFGMLYGCGKTESFRLISEKKVRSCLLGRKRLISYEDAVRLAAEALERGSL